MRVIGLCGFAGAGKTTCAKAIKELIPEAIITSTGDALRKKYSEAVSNGYTNSIQEFNMELAAKLKDKYINIALEGVVTGNIIIIDSLRTMNDYNFIRANYNHFNLISVNAPFSIRLNRIILRQRPHDFKDEVSYEKHFIQEILWGVQELVDNSDFSISNIQNIDYLSEFINSMIDRLGCDVK